ncbi:MAG TPA: hypothetical protein VF653_03500 [Methylomirabilota bacterium]
MQMRTARPILILIVTFAVFAAAYAWGQQTAPPDIKSLAGTWVGFASPTRGSNVPLQVNVKPDGTYASKWGGKDGTGTITMEGGKLMADGHLLYGTGTTTAGTGRAELTLTKKGGKQVISGSGRDNDGPYNFQLTKQ